MEDPYRAALGDRTTMRLSSTALAVWLTCISYGRRLAGVAENSDRRYFLFLFGSGIF